MPVKARLELGTVVGLDNQHSKWQTSQYLVDEADRRALVARVVDLQHAEPRAVIDRRELIEPLLGARNPLEELDVHRQTMPRLRLLVPLPAFGMRAVLLIPWEPV